MATKKVKPMYVPMHPDFGQRVRQLIVELKNIPPSDMVHGRRLGEDDRQVLSLLDSAIQAAILEYLRGPAPRR